MSLNRAKTILQMHVSRIPPFLMTISLIWRWFCQCRVAYSEEAYSSPLYAKGFGHDMFTGYMLVGFLYSWSKDRGRGRPQNRVKESRLLHWVFWQPSGRLHHLLWVDLPKCLWLDHSTSLSFSCLSKEIEMLLLSQASCKDQMICVKCLAQCLAFSTY